MKHIRYTQYATSLLPALLLAVVTFAWMPSALALSSDVEKPVNIEADSAFLDNEKGHAVYSGNVVITQGTIKIRASKVEITAPDSEIQLIHASGAPVRFEQKMDNGTLAKGTARNFKYYVENKKIVLSGTAQLAQNKDIFNSEHMEYFPNTGELHANRNNKQGAKSGRVKAVFHPSNKSKNTAP